MVVLGTGEALLDPAFCGGGKQSWLITAWREVVGCREGVGGGRSTGDPTDNITVGEGRTPASSMHVVEWRSL